MKKIITMLFAIILAFAVLPFSQVGAELADGKYSLPYQVNKAGSTSASMANDYFLKPATLVKKNGTMYVQLTLKNSAQFVKFEATSGGNKVISKDTANDRRTVQFNLSSLAKAQTVNVRIEIPEEDYYHNYKIDFVWFEKNAKLIESYAKPVASTPAATKPAADTAKQEAAKKAEAEKKAKAEAEAAKKAEEAKLKEEEAKKEEAVKEVNKEADKEEVTENTDVAATSEDKKEETASSSTTKQAETADSNATDDEKSSNTTGWVIGIVAVLLVAVGGMIFFRKSKTA